jgi:hypothetical protein
MAEPTTEPIGWSPADGIAISQCLSCLHKRAGYFCDAFPAAAGIPDEILANRFDHRRPHPGDHGVRWELVPGVIVPGSAGDLDA